MRRGGEQRKEGGRQEKAKQHGPAGGGKPSRRSGNAGGGMNGEEGGRGGGENPGAAVDRGLDKRSSNEATMNTSADLTGTDIDSSVARYAL